MTLRTKFYYSRQGESFSSKVPTVLLALFTKAPYKFGFLIDFYKKIPKFSFFYFSIGVLNWAVFAQCQQIAYFRVSDFVKIEKIFGRISFC